MSSSTASVNVAPNASLTPKSKPEIIDDKSPHCIPFILRQLSAFRSSPQHEDKPFFIGLNGVQGAGKTTLVTTLSSLLASPPYSLPTLVCSIDDLYLTHADQTALAQKHASNPLIQHRGEPGTHDIPLARSLFTALKSGQETQIPAYDKSAFNGQGDRVPSSQWKTVNSPDQKKIQVVIFEGWCVGFRALSEAEVRVKREGESVTLGRHRLEDLLFVNGKLGEYEVLNGAFDAFIHIDAEETGYVYAWRQEQEEVLRREKGAGMSREEVERFVDGYYPAYELFTEKLRNGLFGGDKGRQLRLVVGRDRRVKEVIGI
ncbi:P-loop containing nucleoside triphosphate hydrolase protein [Hyaloscypha hepaticicola]|uniref:P-loop containing nucleoside triphosphate hydrolase protein n=1 Tax=Hyaloscypha hepaticicola TaxID=2082293 RepID=A0A2J6Q1I5_9HELO|nr:P-loop containing nucleoside triphosphate hydrolase protein [Hyaloscypha hepaticicola]